MHHVCGLGSTLMGPALDLLADQSMAALRRMRQGAQQHIQDGCTFVLINYQFACLAEEAIDFGQWISRPGVYTKVRCQRCVSRRGVDCNLHIRTHIETWRSWRT